MTPPAEPRSPAQRRRDVEQRLATDIDGWVATASADGVPHLIPLSIHWDGTSLLMATNADSPTAANIRQTGRARVALGRVRDVVLLDGVVDVRQMSEVDPMTADAFARRSGFDPRPLRTPYSWLLLRPERVQAWREENELAERVLMRRGRWLAQTNPGVA